MQMPTPNDHHRALARLTGRWRGVETMHPSPWDPKGGKADGETESRVDLGGFAVIADYRQLKDGQVTYTGHGVYTIDPEGHDVVLHWFDAIAGQREEFRGRWDGDVLTIRSRSPSGHARLTYDLSEPDRMRSAMDMSPDGETWNRPFDGVYERVG